MLFFTTIMLVGLFITIVLLAAIGHIARGFRPKKLSEIRLHTDFCVAELHALHLSGQLSVDEYERAKAVVLARLPEPSSKGGHGFAVIQESKQTPP